MTSRFGRGLRRFVDSLQRGLFDDVAESPVEPVATDPALAEQAPVDPLLRRRGIATALLNRVLERVEPDAQLTLEVRRSNAGAITLYESFGFRSAGVRRRYYADNGEDAIVMWRTPATLRGTLDDVPGT